MLAEVSNVSVYVCVCVYTHIHTYIHAHFWFHELEEFVVAFKCSFYLGVLEERFVIFLICGDMYVNVVHLVLLLDPVDGVVWVILCCICCLNLIRRFSGKLLLLEIFSMIVHSSCCCSLLRGRVNILSM